MNRLPIFVLAVLSLATPAWAQSVPDDRRPIVVQGAMQLEIERLAARLDHVSEERVGGWTFWRGTVDGYPVIVSKTLKGVSNAAAATVIAAERYHPLAIINQGTAGGHDPSLRLYDIVLGTRAVSLSAFKSPFRPVGAGSNPLDWTPLDLMAREGSAGNDPMEHAVATFRGDETLLAAARRAMAQYTRGRVVEGVIGTSEIWNDELDLIAWFHAQYGTAVEEMETASAAQVAGLLHIPFLGIRVVSDNITNGEPYDPKTGEACEDYVFQVVKAYIASEVARGASAEPSNRVAILAAAKVIIAKARYATFITLDDTGHPQARIVDPFAPDEDLTIWVATNALSRKVGQIAADERVTLTYFDAGGQNYVTVLGTATAVRDPQEKARHWKDEWAAFYKDKNRGDDYLLIRITPTRLEVVGATLGMTNDPVTWQPVILELRPPPKRH